MYSSTGQFRFTVSRKVREIEEIFNLYYERKIIKFVHFEDSFTLLSV